METVFYSVTLRSNHSTMMICQPGHHTDSDHCIKKMKEVMEINYSLVNCFGSTDHIHNISGLIARLAWIKLRLF